MSLGHSDFEMAVGDVNSQEKGSGARANGGKPRMDLIPLRITVEALRTSLNPYEIKVLEYVAQFEEGDDAAIWRALRFIGEIDGGVDIKEAAHVLEYGANKYAAWNWLCGMPWSVPLGCIGRHVLAIADDEERDEESGRGHWGHVVCNIIMLAMFTRVYTDGDDRPPKELFE